MANNNRIFITGGASGLGKAIAIHYAKLGFNIAIGDISTENLAATQAELAQFNTELLTFHCDTRSEQSLIDVRNNLQEQWGGIDILVNNAGVAGTYGDVGQVSLDDWQTVFDINLFGVVRGCKVFAESFKHQKSGAIVNIASMAGLLTPPNAAGYNASKAAVVALSETVRYEMTPFGVSVHAVCPAFFKTNLTQSMKSNPKAKAFVDREMEKSSVTASDVAHMIEQQIRSNNFLLLTHKKERRLWQLKRFFPSVYQNLVAKAFAKINKKQIQSQQPL